MPKLRPPFGFGFAGLNRKLREWMAGIEKDIEDIEVGAVSPETIPLESDRYTAENVGAALDEIAGEGRTNETVKGLADDVALMQLSKITQTGEVTLIGNVTPVSFGDSGPAYVESEEEENFDPLSNADAFTVAVDGESPVTITIEGTAATFTPPATDYIEYEALKAQPDNRLKIAIDQDFWNGVWHEIAPDWGAAANDAGVATAIQTAIQAITGGEADYSGVTVAASGTDKLIITGNSGEKCVIGIDHADSADAVDELDWAPRNEGVQMTLFMDGADAGALRLIRGDTGGYIDVEHDATNTDIQTALRELFDNDGITVADDADFTITFPVSAGEAELLLLRNTLMKAGGTEEAAPTLVTGRYYWERYTIKAGWGTGNIDYLHMPTAQSVADLLAAELSDEDVDVTVTEDLKVRVETHEVGGAASLNFTNTNETPCASLDFATDVQYGSVGLGFEVEEMDDDEYWVGVTHTVAHASINASDRGFSVTNRTTSGFSIENKHGYTDGVMVAVIGTPASE